MKTIGIIAEYNPFHQGHIHQINTIRQEADAIVVITSGYFTQRGLPSLLSPQDKTRLALRYGADLVLELPFCYACQSADYFAKYAIESLHQLHIDALCFGSECNDINHLRNIWRQISTVPKDAAKSINHNLHINLQPNDILALQYIKYCDFLHIKPLSIPRNPQYTSASKIRDDFFQGKKADFDQFFHKEQNWNAYYPYLRTFLMMSDPSDLQSFFLVKEGIEYRLQKAAERYNTYTDFLDGCISKTYSKARIQRTLLFMMMQVKTQDMKQNEAFKIVKVMGMNSVGQKLLKENKEAAICTRFKELPAFLQQIELKSLALYNSVMATPLPKKQVIHYD